MDILNPTTFSILKVLQIKPASQKKICNISGITYSYLCKCLPKLMAENVIRLSLKTIRQNMYQLTPKGWQVLEELKDINTQTTKQISNCI